MSPEDRPTAVVSDDEPDPALLVPSLFSGPLGTIGYGFEIGVTAH